MQWTSLLDLNSHSIRSPYCHEAFQKLTLKKASRKTTYESIQAITCALVPEILNDIALDTLTLVPVLRGGLAMWTTLYASLNAPSTCFSWCRKNKGTREVSLTWLTEKPDPDHVIMLVDTVIATGDTIIKLVSSLDSHFEIYIASCYVSPEAIEQIAKAEAVKKVYCGIVSVSVDDNGFLIPPTHGDIGDKLFD